MCWLCLQLELLCCVLYNHLPIVARTSSHACFQPPPRAADSNALLPATIPLLVSVQAPVCGPAGGNDSWYFNLALQSSLL